MTSSTPSDQRSTSDWFPSFGPYWSWSPALFEHRLVPSTGSLERVCFNRSALALSHFCWPRTEESLQSFQIACCYRSRLSHPEGLGHPPGALSFVGGSVRAVPSTFLVFLSVYHYLSCLALPWFCWTQSYACSSTFEGKKSWRQPHVWTLCSSIRRRMACRQRFWQLTWGQSCLEALSCWVLCSTDWSTACSWPLSFRHLLSFWSPSAVFALYVLRLLEPRGTAAQRMAKPFSSGLESRLSNWPSSWSSYRC